MIQALEHSQVKGPCGEASLYIKQNKLSDELGTGEERGREREREREREQRRERERERDRERGTGKQKERDKKSKGEKGQQKTREEGPRNSLALIIACVLVLSK